MAKKKRRIVRKPRPQAAESVVEKEEASAAADEEPASPASSKEEDAGEDSAEDSEPPPESGEAPTSPDEAPRSDSDSADTDSPFDPEEGTEQPDFGLVGEGVDVDESEVEDTEGYLKGLVEALIFSSDKPQSSKEIARAAKIDRGRAQELIEQLLVETKDRGVRLVEVAEGYAFRTNPAYSRYVREYLAQRPVRLSRAQLETLAIVAYRQPITRPEVDDIRGVDSGAVLKLLLERELIRILGKKDEPGRPMIYGTAPAFLDLFSLSSLRDLPTLREFTELSEDSRAKFELEIGEPAPEGPIDFSEAEEDSHVSESDVDSDSSDAPEPDADGSAQAEEDTSETEAEELHSEDAEAESEGDSEDGSENDESETPLNPDDEAEFPDDEDDDEDDEDDDEDDDDDDE